MAQHFKDLETAIDAFSIARDQQKANEVQATRSVLKKLGGLGALLGLSSTAASADSDSDKNKKVRGLAHFQNASLQFSGAIIAAGLIGLANARSIPNEPRIAGLTAFETIVHLIGSLIAGAIVVTLAAATTQFFYRRLRRDEPRPRLERGGLWILSIIGALIMARAGSPFVLEILSKECSGEGLLSWCKISQAPT